VRLFSLPSKRVEFSERIAVDTSLRGEQLEDLEGQSYLGDLLVRVGRPGDGRRHLKRITDRDPMRARAIAATGLIELEAGRVDEAVRLLEEAAARAPEDAAISSMLGRALVTRVQQLPSAHSQFTAAVEQARGALERATKLDDAAAHTFAMLGYVILLSGKDAGLAASHLSTAVRMAPTREAYQMRLAEALLRDRQFERASSYLGPLAERARAPDIREAAQKLLATVVQRQLDAR
jgi:predicted Zn-dependent protease